MYRVMMMVMLKDMWRYVKKEKFSLLWYMLIVAIAFQNMAVLLGIETVQVISINLQMADLKKMILVCAAFFLICIVQLMRGIPLRICKAMYLCPAGEREGTIFIRNACCESCRRNDFYWSIFKMFGRSRILGRRYHVYGYNVWTLFFYAVKCESDFSNG